MLIERDGSDTPPSRFSYSVGDRAQLSHFDKSQATKTAAALSGGMDLCFRSFPPSGAAVFLCPDSTRPRTCGEIRTAYAAKAAKQSLFHRN